MIDQSSSKSALALLLVVFFCFGCGEDRSVKHSELKTLKKQLQEIQEGLEANRQQNEKIGRWRIYSSGNARDALLLDTATGRSFEPVRYSYLEGQPIVWVERFIRPNPDGIRLESIAAYPNKKISEQLSEKRTANEDRYIRASHKLLWAGNEFPTAEELLHEVVELERQALAEKNAIEEAKKKNKDNARVQQFKLKAAQLLSSIKEIDEWEALHLSLYHRDLFNIDEKLWTEEELEELEAKLADVTNRSFEPEKKP